jgi:hypothetical protein
MIATIESEKTERASKKKKSFDVSAKGLDAWGKEFGLLGWASGTSNCCEVKIKKKRSIISGKFTKYLKLHRGISNEALEVLKQDNEEFGSETIFTLASLHPVVKGGGRNNLNLRDVIMMFS